MNMKFNNAPVCEEKIREAKEWKAYLMSLREAAISDGMKTFTPDELVEIWADERAGGEGVNRIWRY